MRRAKALLIAIVEALRDERGEGELADVIRERAATLITMSAVVYVTIADIGAK